MPSIRNIAVGLPVRAGRVLVLQGEDRVKHQAFHRAIGGGIEFGETAETALRREFREELDVAIDRAELLTVIENLFEYEGRPGHEIAHVFAVESAELDAVPLDARLHVLDEGSPVRWVELAGATDPFYPEGITPIIGALQQRAAAHSGRE